MSEGYLITTGFIHLIGSLRSEITLRCSTVKSNKVMRPPGLVCSRPVLNESTLNSVPPWQTLFFFVCVCRFFFCLQNML